MSIGILSVHGSPCWCRCRQSKSSLCLHGFAPTARRDVLGGSQRPKDRTFPASLSLQGKLAWSQGSSSPGAEWSLSGLLLAKGFL